MAKKPDPFNNAFSSLRIKSDAPAKPEAAPPPPPPAKVKKHQQVSIDAEAAEFLAAVGAVEKPRPPKAKVSPAVRAEEKAASTRDNLEGLLELAELVAPEADFVLDGLEGQVRGLDAGVIEHLRNGDFEPMAKLVLADPKKRVLLDEFVQSARVKGLRCVEVECPAIEALPALLTSGRTGRQVLAFCLIGQQAMQVLLRR